MVEPIGRLISECFYEGKLTSYRTKLSKSLTQFTGYAVNWLSTRDLPNRFEQGADTSFVNPREASEIRELLLSIDQHLAAAKVNKRMSVLVLSGYGAQVRHLERRITQIRPHLQLLDVECCTVDRIQGREAAIVIFSITRCNRTASAGHLRAIERTNVALSRAQNLLIIVGDDDFVESATQADPLVAVLGHIREWPSECLLCGIRDERKYYSEE
jgi:superfamily I DNA and/or RNA helicase